MVLPLKNAGVLKDADDDDEESKQNNQEVREHVNKAIFRAM